MIRSFMREAGLLVAFVVLGGLLLLCLWVTNHINHSLFKEFKDTQISVVLKTGGQEAFRTWIERAPDVIRYKVLSPLDNKDKLGATYPELRNLVGPLDQKFFPASAVVTVAKPEAFLKALSGLSSVVEVQVLHQPPLQLQRFLEVLSAIFSGLWLLTLSLVLYFNLERLAASEENKWSLMKMLGSKSLPIFLPLWSAQMIRVGIAALCAVFLAVIATRQIQSFFIWDWVSLPSSIWIGFLFASLGLTTLISFSLFHFRYKRVALG